MSGSCAKPSTTARRLRQPPDKAAACVSKSMKPARLRASSARNERSCSDTPERCKADSMTDLHVDSGGNWEICSTNLSLAPLRMATSPLSGFTRPTRISSNVDLPDPFGPIRPMRSPSDTVNEIFLNSGATPNFFERSCALIMGPELLNLLFLLLQVYTRTVPTPRRTGMLKGKLGLPGQVRARLAQIDCVAPDVPA